MDDVALVVHAQLAQLAQLAQCLIATGLEKMSIVKGQMRGSPSSY
jgi:hypothetical protein